MTKLSLDKFELAKKFIYRNARPVDKQLFALYFEEGSYESVISELSKYQNPDGGFGKALEPDFRLKASSPMATSVGFQYCIELNIDPEHPLVKSAIDYLVNTYCSQHGFWPSTFMDVNEEPHAPWWHLENVALLDKPDWANPSAELVGYLHKYKKNVPLNFLDVVTKHTQKYVDSINQVKTFWPHVYNLMCWERASKHLPEPLKSNVIDELKRYFAELGPLTADMLKEVRALWISPSPNSILYKLSPCLAEDLFDDEIARQSADGGWWPTWEWGQYEEVWQVAKREWAGKITVDSLCALKRFEKIDL